MDWWLDLVHLIEAAIWGYEYVTLGVCGYILANFAKKLLTPSAA